MQDQRKLFDDKFQKTYAFIRLFNATVTELHVCVQISMTKNGPDPAPAGQKRRIIRFLIKPVVATGSIRLRPAKKPESSDFLSNPE